jgi:hypothetical protein
LSLRALSLAAVLAAGACATSSADVKEAREAVYQADRQVVWSAIQAEMHARYRDAIKVENEEQGYLETSWKRVDAQHEGTAGESNQTGAVRAVYVFRMLVKMEGGPPWRIHVDGQAAQYRSDLTVLAPFTHGAIDEPHWVPGRIESVRAALHKRLKSYAVQPPAP